MLVYRKSPYAHNQRFGHHYHTDRNNCQSPAANVIESNDEYIIKMAVPGFNKKDIIIDVDQKVLKISSKKTSEPNALETVLRKEFSVDAFERKFELPDSIDSDKIEATYKNGVLSLCIPKMEFAKTKPAREILIS